MEYVYTPFIENLKKEDWGVIDEESKEEYLNHTKKFADEVGEAIKLMSPS